MQKAENQSDEQRGPEIHPVKMMNGNPCPAPYEFRGDRACRNPKARDERVDQSEQSPAEEPSLP